MPLDISSIVRVTAQVAPQGVLRRDFGRTLFLTIDDTLHPVGGRRVMTFASIREVADVFLPTSEPYQAAAIYFQQVPYPRNLIVARWANAAVDAEYRGARISATLDQLLAVNLTVMQIEDNALTNIQAYVDGAVSFAAYAEGLQAGLRSLGGLYVGANVTYSAERHNFTIVLPPVGDVAFSVADISIARRSAGLDSRDYDFVAGTGEQTIEEALDGIQDVEADWYFVTCDKAVTKTDGALASISAWVASRDVMFSADALGADILVTAEEASVPAQLSALESDRTWLTWSATEDYKALSAAGRFSSVNFNQPNGIITGKFKELPGTLADGLNTTAKNELDRKGINHYSPFSGDNIYAEATTLKPGTFIDVRYALDWFVNGIQTSVYNLLRQSPSRVPQTNVGLVAVKNVIEEVCEQAIRNGMIAPGQLTEALANDIRLATRDEDFEGFLSNGYLVYVIPIAEQPQSERSQRRSPPFRIWVKGGGALHFANVDIVFEN